ncbi:MAG: thiamine pyrophosphate-binding protein [Synergistaceae bacterium]|jgi:acetolactate synthase-1/2/3 large subunit|nr:thiamine pyrophosphate-binding protein [Synergistaceae bacterium]
MRLSDYVVSRLAETGVRDVFFVPGYGNTHLVDALARDENINGVSVHHEQSAAMAAVAYAKYNCDFGACFVTTGCGGTNAVTGLLHAYQDSVPCLFVSGQSDTKHIIDCFDVRLRQVGKQEADIISIVRSITKYAVTVKDAREIALHFDRALFYAKTGRPGPVWLDIPLDVQSAPVDAESLERFHPEPPEADVVSIRESARELALDIKRAQRPIILAGNGVRSSHSVLEFQKFARDFGLPVATTKMAVDILDTEGGLFTGVVGSQSGSRAGNFAVANSDLLIVLGCRLSVNVTGADYGNFAREARVVAVDIDGEEHSKNTVRIDRLIQADLKTFLGEINTLVPPEAKRDWIEKCAHWKKIFPFLTEEERNADAIDLYLFNEKMSMAAKDNAVFVSDAGNVCFTTPASVVISGGKRSITSGAQAEMGFSLPGAIGACYASGMGEVGCVTGDGSVMMNIQELATISFRKLPIKIFVINNGGYASIRAMQKEAYRGRTLGTDGTNGLGLPSFERIAAGFDLKYVRINDAGELDEKLGAVFSFDGPVLCEVMCARVQKNFLVAMGRSPEGRMGMRPLEDLSPFLDREIFLKEMIIKPV